jgi:hypothetical protein
MRNTEPDWLTKMWLDDVSGHERGDRMCKTCQRNAIDKVGGHLAANFSIRNYLVLLMLKHNFKVGGQVVHTLAEPRKTVTQSWRHLAVDFSSHNSLN